MKYNDYLISHAWYLKKEEYFAKYKKLCARCFATKNLQIHHLTYKNLFHEDLEDLICLCKDCHDRETYADYDYKLTVDEANDFKENVELGYIGYYGTKEIYKNTKFAYEIYFETYQLTDVYIYALLIVKDKDYANARVTVDTIADNAPLNPSNPNFLRRKIDNLFVRNKLEFKQGDKVALFNDSTWQHYDLQYLNVEITTIHNPLYDLAYIKILDLLDREAEKYYKKQDSTTDTKKNIKLML